MNIHCVEIFQSCLSENWNPVLIRITTDQGPTGVGELALAYGRGAPAGAAMIQCLCRRILPGLDPLASEEVWQRMFEDSFWAKGGGAVIFGAISAIDQALWDIRGKVMGQPVWRLLGGPCHKRIRLYANGWYHGMGKPEQFAQRAAQVAAEGFTATKFDPFAYDQEGNPCRHGRLSSADQRRVLSRVEAVREAVGDDFDILIEAHGNLDADSAIRIAPHLAELDVLFLEEPVHPLNAQVMARIARSCSLPLAGGERLYSRFDFRPFVESQSLSILQPDLGLAGGITEVKKIADFAHLYDLKLAPHNCAGPINTAASVHLDAAISNFLIQETFPYHARENLELVTDPLEDQIRDGHLELPQRPGLGVEINDEALSTAQKVTLKF